MRRLSSGDLYSQFLSGPDDELILEFIHRDIIVFDLYVEKDYQVVFECFVAPFSMEAAELASILQRSREQLIQRSAETKRRLDELIGPSDGPPRRSQRILERDDIVISRVTKYDAVDGQPFAQLRVKDGELLGVLQRTDSDGVLWTSHLAPFRMRVRPFCSLLRDTVQTEDFRA